MTKKLEPFDFFVLRSPLLSPDIGMRFLEKSKLQEVMGESNDDETVVLIRTVLRATAPEFFERARKKFDEKAQKTLVRYILRMSTRPIPFGLFSGFSVGRISENRAYRFKPLKEWTVYSKIGSSEVLRSLVSEATSMPTTLFPHPSLQIEGHTLAVSKRVLNDDGSTKEVKKVVLRTNDSGLELIRKRKGRTKDQKSYLESLRKHNILVPSISFKDYFGGTSWKKNSFEELFKGAPVGQNLILKKEVSECTLDQSTVTQVAKGIEVLNRLFSVQNHVWNKQSREIGHFCLSFEKKFPNLELSLIKALDPIYGVLDATFQETKGMEPLHDDFTSVERFFEERIHRSSMRLEELDLSNADLEQLQKLDEENKYRFTKIPSSVTAHCAFFHGRIHLKSYAGMPSIQYLSRLGSPDDELSAEISKVVGWDSQQNKDVVLAEIIDWPTSLKVASFAARRVFHEYVIPIDYPPSFINTDKHLALDDLMISVAYGRIRIRSKRLNKEVIPVFSTLYNLNYEKNPFMKFLAQVAAQDNFQLAAWRWGSLRRLPYLPRVRVGNVILSLRQWRISERDITSIYKDKNPYEKFLAIAKSYGLPERFLWCFHTDLKLYVDVQNKLNVEAVLDQLKTQWAESTSHIEECSDETLTSDLLIPIKNNDPVTKDPFPHLRRDPNLKDASLLHVGDECVYFKLYMNSASYDEVLVNEVRALLGEKAIKENVKYWFFIKYLDPSPHLRIRLFLKKKDSWDIVIRSLNRLQKKLTSSYKIWNFQMETYKRDFDGNEKDRWRSFDSYSFADSERTLDLFSKYKFTEFSRERKFVYLVLLAHTLMKSSMDLETRIQFTRSARVAYETMGFRASAADKSFFQEFWRTHRSEVMNYIVSNKHEIFGEHLGRYASRIKVSVTEVSMQRMIHLSLNRSMTGIRYPEEDQIYSLLYRAYMEEAHK